MSHKSARIASLIENCQGQQHDPHYLAYFELFNTGAFYDSHDVLEELWLAERKKPNDAFYKGLIQIAGAFVHLQKNRLGPASALFKLAQANMQAYPRIHLDLDVAALTALINAWLQKLEAGALQTNPLDLEKPPQIRLVLKAAN